MDWSRNVKPITKQQNPYHRDFGVLWAERKGRFVELELLHFPNRSDGWTFGLTIWLHREAKRDPGQYVKFLEDFCQQMGRELPEDKRKKFLKNGIIGLGLAPMESMSKHRVESKMLFLFLEITAKGYQRSKSKVDQTKT